MDVKKNLELVKGYYDPWLVGGRKSEIDKVGFFNYGYWNGLGVGSLEVAQINLIETLVSFFTNTEGNVLDVACGKGVSSKFLTKYFRPQQIVGTNISKAQLEVCNHIAPECEFREMDATSLEFSSDSIDNILCIEAAFHFVTRNDFIKEAHRVLKSGGRIAMSDVVVHDHDLLRAFLPADTVATLPKENGLANLASYKQLFLDSGFKHIRVEDTTDDSVLTLHKYLLLKAEREFDGSHDYDSLKYHTSALEHWRSAATWCLAYAIK